jgi:hypothetical protein
MIRHVQSAGSLDIDFTISNFQQQCCVTCLEKSCCTAGTASTHCLFHLLIFNQIQ